VIGTGSYLIWIGVLAEPGISVDAEYLHQMSKSYSWRSYKRHTYQILGRELRDRAVLLGDFLRQTVDEGLPVLFGSAVLGIVD
jgi:hypothetical protein